jgi:CRP-like cAMP-binding protein
MTITMRKSQILNPIPTNAASIWESAEILDDIGQMGRERIFACGEIIEARSGSILISEGEPATHLFIMGSGKAQIMIKSVEENENVPIYYAKLGEILGLNSLLEPDLPYSISVQMQDAGILFRLNVQELMVLLKTDQELGFLFMRNLAKVTARRLNKMNRRAINFTRKQSF